MTGHIISQSNFSWSSYITKQLSEYKGRIRYFFLIPYLLVSYIVDKIYICNKSCQIHKSTNLENYFGEYYANEQSK